MKNTIQTLIGKLKPSCNKKLYSSLRFEVIETGDKFKFISKTKKDLQIQVGDQTLEFNENMKFPKDITNVKNISVLSFSDVKFQIGQNYSDSVYKIYLSDEQIDSVKSIMFNNTNIFENNHYEYSVSKLDEFWCISVSKHLENVSYKATVNFDSTYPSIQIENSCLESNSDFDITEMVSKKLSINIPNSIQGKISIGHKLFDINEYMDKNLIPDIRSSKLYVLDLNQEIKKWNNEDITVTVFPQNFTPVQKQINLNEGQNVIKFDQDEFNSLSTIKVCYPIELDVNPRISYIDTSIDLDIIPDGIQSQIYNSYSKTSKTENKQEFVFKSVIPGKLRVFHTDGFVNSKFDDACKDVEINIDKSKTINLNPSPRKVHLRLTNDRSKPVTVDINDTSEYIAPDDMKKLEAKLKEDDNIIKIYNESGSILTRKCLDKYECMALSEETVTGFSNN